MPATAFLFDYLDFSIFADGFWENYFDLPKERCRETILQIQPPLVSHADVPGLGAASFSSMKVRTRCAQKPSSIRRERRLARLPPRGEERNVRYRRNHR